MQPAPSKLWLCQPARPCYRDVRPPSSLLGRRPGSNPFLTLLPACESRSKRNSSERGAGWAGGEALSGQQSKVGGLGLGSEEGQ